MKRISTFRYHSRGAGEHVGKVDAEEYTYRDREILDEDLQVSVILYEGLYGCQLGIIQEPKRLYRWSKEKMIRKSDCDHPAFSFCRSRRCLIKLQTTLILASSSLREA